MILLKLARQAVELAAAGHTGPTVPLDDLPEALRARRATFVTLTRQGTLRGCVGSLQASVPLAQDLVVHARAAATEDFRFYPVRPEETAELEIEVSILSEPTPLDYQQSDELLTRLRPGVDGVILTSGLNRATFLPQVWEKVAQPSVFLDMLCEKAGLPRRAWRTGHPDILTYQVESFHETEAAAA
ncbi:MAG: AmmeMemoRadiSam system protein A [Anaerolineales bacterium]|nr:AmmeMemoRadiSam system protein A [Anaerolineales bacterium]